MRSSLLIGSELKATASNSSCKNKEVKSKVLDGDDIYNSYIKDEWIEIGQRSI